MVSAMHRQEPADPLTTFTASASTSKSSTSSFSQQLATALDGDLVNSKKESPSKTQSSSVSGQESDARQISGSVTPRQAGPTTGSNTTTTTTGSSTSTTSKSTASSSTSSSSSNIPTMLGMGPVAGTPPVQEVTDPTPAPAPEITEADAYWDAQPAAVQALRYMPDGQAKDDLALQLANEGYSIDTQIMVWGWDPQMTMQIRENQGYSWVPSYGSANIPVGPGLSMPGESDTYDPSSPPPGAIIVSTAFANGTIQNPLVQTNSTS